MFTFLRFKAWLADRKGCAAEAKRILKQDADIRKWNAAVDIKKGKV